MISLAYAPLDSYVTAQGYPVFDEDQSQVYPTATPGWYDGSEEFYLLMPWHREKGLNLTNTPPMQAIVYNPPPEWGQMGDDYLCCIYGWSSENPGYMVEVFTYNGGESPTYVFSKYANTYEELRPIAATLHPKITPQELKAAGWDSHGTY